MTGLRTTAAALLLGLLATPLTAEPLTCTDPTVTVRSEDRTTAVRACEAAENARAALARCGIAPPAPVEIVIQPRIEDQPAGCLGTYHCGDGRIEILDPAAMAATRSRDDAFSEVPDADFWDSIVVHEMTHAAYDRVTCPFSSCRASAEYASYVMQIGSLAPEARAALDAEAERAGPVDREAISEMVYALSPDGFARRAWRHFRSLDAPCAFLRDVMEGRVFFDFEPV